MREESEQTTTIRVKYEITAPTTSIIAVINGLRNTTRQYPLRVIYPSLEEFPLFDRISIHELADKVEIAAGMFQVASSLMKESTKIRMGISEAISKLLVSAGNASNCLTETHTLYRLVLIPINVILVIAGFLGIFRLYH